MKDDWNKAARAFAQVSEVCFDRATAPFFAFAGLRPGWSVLDVACGPGTSTRRAARWVRPGGRVLGLDISEPMLAVARRRVAPGVSFEKGDAHRLARVAGSCDAVLCHLGLMLFDRPAHALSEMRRALKPGGVFACVVLGVDERMVFTSAASSLLEGKAPALGRFGEPEALAAALEKAGFRKVRTKVLRGTFPVASAGAYWKIVTTAFGRLGPLIRALPPADRARVKEELYLKLAVYKRGRKLRIPYEFVLARGAR